MATERPTLRAFAEEQERRGLSKRTIQGRHRTLVAFFSTLGDTPAVGASRDQVRDFLDACELGARSRYTYISTLNAFYAWAVEEGLAIVNPVKTIRRPKTPRLVPRPISSADVSTALEYADPRMRTFIALGAYAGLRTVEMAGLTREDVLDGREPPLLLVRHGKGGKERVLPLHPEIALALRRLPMPRRGSLFHLNDGSPMKAQTIGSYIANYLHDLSIPASAHQLRHAFLSELYRLSKDIRLCQEMAGHASPQTTAAYAAWSPVDAAVMVSMLGGGG